MRNYLGISTISAICTGYALLLTFRGFSRNRNRNRGFGMKDFANKNFARKGDKIDWGVLALLILFGAVTVALVSEQIHINFGF